MEQSANKQPSGEDRWIATVCDMCYCCCGVKARRVDGVVTDIMGDPDNPGTAGKVCAKGRAALMTLYDPFRVKSPLIRTNPQKGIGIDPQWKQISWDEVLDILVEKLEKIRQDDPRKLVLGGWDYQLFSLFWVFASAYGTPNLWKGAADYFCGNGLHPILYLTNGAFYGEVDLEHCNYCLLFGTQFGFMLMTDAVPMARHMAEARDRGLKVVAIDPVCTNAGSKADEWLAIRPGTDAALALGLLNILLNEEGIYDREFLARYTNGPYLIADDGLYIREELTGKPLIWETTEKLARAYDSEGQCQPALEGQYVVSGRTCRPAFELLKEHVRAYTPERVAEITTLPAEAIRRVAKEFGQAASVGSKVIIQGQELPLRPASAIWNKGAISHAHAMLTGMAIQLLNIVVGAMDVPGGMLGSRTKGPFWEPREGPDGLIMPAQFQVIVDAAYPARAVGRPETVEFRELFPVSSYSAPLFEEAMLNPEKYQFPYQPELLIQVRSNPMMSSSNPERMAAALTKFPYMVRFSPQLDETAELADMVLPDTHSLERLVPFPSVRAEGIPSGQGHWYWIIGQPVVEPVGESRNWAEVFLELAHRLNILPDMCVMINNGFNFKEPFQLDPTKKQTLEDITDAWAKSWFGAEHGLDWFRKNGCLITAKKKIEEAFPRPFIKPRIPLYLEYLKKAGEEVEKVTKEANIDWDTSDYQPLPDWKPCPEYEKKSNDYDLFPVNFKLPFHGLSVTTVNSWLNEVCEHHPFAFKLLINTETARKKNIRSGQIVWVESKTGKLKGEVRLTECIHPEVIALAGTFGHYAQGMPGAQDKGMHFNRLLPSTPDRLCLVTAALDTCVRVKVSPETT